MVIIMTVIMSQVHLNARVLIMKVAIKIKMDKMSVVQKIFLG
jgi:hypothetical protein